MPLCGALASPTSGRISPLASLSLYIINRPAGILLMASKIFFPASAEHDLSLLPGQSSNMGIG